MTPETTTPRAAGDRWARAAALGSVGATLFTSVACVGPLVAILLGVGGMGWLTQYAYLRVPATILTAAFLALGFYLAYRPSPCGLTRKRKASRTLLWIAATLALAVNFFEYITMPHLV